MEVRFSFEKAATERCGYTLEAVHQTIKSLFAVHDLPCVSDGEPLAFQDKGHGDDFAVMWDIILSLLRADWFMDCAAIAGNLEDIEAGRRPEIIHRPYYQPYKEHPKYTGFMALYVHYLYVLGKIEKRQYPPRMTPRLQKDVMRFERYREQFSFLRENNIVIQEDMTAFQSRTEDELANFMKQRTILNVRKKKRKGLYDALADVAALEQAKALYEEGLSGMEAEFSRYMEAEAVLERSGVPREQLTAEKAAIYEQLAQVNADIRTARKKLSLCKEIQDRLPQMEQTIEKIESREMENHEKHRGRQNRLLPAF